jgi:hypothetical protein
MGKGTGRVNEALDLVVSPLQEKEKGSKPPAPDED